MTVLGQSNIQKQLVSAIASERFPHAVLMLGPEGGAGLATAFWLTQVLLCENSDVETRPCGACSACQKTQKGIHPDVHFSMPTVGPKGVSTTFAASFRAFLLENPFLTTNDWLEKIRQKETANAQGNITSEETLAILKKLSLKVFEGRYKILLLWRPEFLGEQGNKLLKMIEEPPEQTVFLLVAENADLILPTILSRTQLVKIDRLSDDDVKNGLLFYKKGIAEARAERIAFLADGSLGAAIEMAGAETSDEATFFLDWLRECFKNDGRAMLKRTDQFATFGRENQKQLLSYGLHFLRELLIVQNLGSEKARLRASELETAQKMSKIIDFKKLGALVSLLSDAHFHIERNANPRILWLDASIKAHSILRA